MQCLPERCEYAIGIAVTFQQLPGFQQQAGIEAARGDARVDECVLECAIAGHRLRFVAAVPQYLADRVTLSQCGENLRWIAPLDNQFRAEFAQTTLQRGEAVMQPPAAGRAR